MNLWELPLTIAAESVRRGELTSVELARALCDRIESVEDRVRALANFDRERLLRAASASDGRGLNGDREGPLAGIPVGVKDIYDCEGYSTAHGISDRRTERERQTAPSIERLIRAGALIAAKTVTTERAFLDPGPTRNPWRLEHTPGGSSSGSAAGTAAGYFPAAIGSQTAGSVIRPAAYCGVVGMTLTHGRVPLDGVLPLAPSFDTLGFFTRSLDDAELLLDALLDTQDDAPIEGGLDRTVMLGLVRDGLIDHIEPEALEHLLKAVGMLCERNTVVQLVQLPAEFGDFSTHQKRIFAFEAAGVHGRDFEADPDAFGSEIGRLVAAGLKVPRPDYEASLAAIRSLREAMLARLDPVDAFVLPATTGAAPRGLGSTGNPLCNAPWTAFGFPAITLPGAFSPRDRLPLGLQLVGAPGGERALLRTARYCMNALGLECRVAPVARA